MPSRPCPQCNAPTPRLLEESSKDSWFSYYRCGVCKNVWTYPKGEELTADPRIVTVFTDRQRQAS